jgi:hypothetical protein
MQHLKKTPPRKIANPSTRKHSFNFRYAARVKPGPHAFITFHQLSNVCNDVLRRTTSARRLGYAIALTLAKYHFLD